MANICGANKNPNPKPKPDCTALPVSKKPMSLHIQSDSINAQNKPFNISGSVKRYAGTYLICSEESAFMRRVLEILENSF